MLLFLAVVNNDKGHWLSDTNCAVNVIWSGHKGPFLMAPQAYLFLKGNVDNVSGFYGILIRHTYINYVYIYLSFTGSVVFYFQC